MPEARNPNDRIDLLADVAEMYFIKNMNQAQIAKRVGVTRSMVSRMISEAQRQGIVHIQIMRSISYEYGLQDKLIERFGLKSAFVVSWQNDNSRLLQHIGIAGARALKPHLAPQQILGLPWGTTVSAVVDAIEIERPLSIKIVQLLGALGARNLKFDGHGLVQRLAQKFGGDAYFLNAPFLVESAEMVQALCTNNSIKETLDLAKHCDIALLGVGSVIPEYSSYYQTGYLGHEELDHLQRVGAVGGICGVHFDIQGHSVAPEFQSRLITISREDLLRIPIRIGVAGGIGKAPAILGALRSGLLNMIVTDSGAANELLCLDQEN
jgi:deoxyribonucleoside regulator